MGRKYIDCRDHPSDVKCSVALSADTVDELIEAVVNHTVAVHGYEDSADLRQMIRDGIKEMPNLGL